ncbi:hypothetical protein [Xanthomarina spongicola]|uniref:Uncharacterized protein n=1 Tax=Xanthomarina spongicola TaxID=570520 RepID=A0A316DLI4_9FLAO|nr:hypothetical protein [Xanthomarina spongicola]PWK18576.1 hypothetical protein LX78_01883 [Xanthomarina spongicola]
MKKMFLLLIISSLYVGLVSCDPESIEDNNRTAECCGNEGDLPPPPPPSGG